MNWISSGKICVTRLPGRVLPEQLLGVKLFALNPYVICVNKCRALLD